VGRKRGGVERLRKGGGETGRRDRGGGGGEREGECVRGRERAKVLATSSGGLCGKFAWRLRTEFAAGAGVGVTARGESCSLYTEQLGTDSA